MSSMAPKYETDLRRTSLVLICNNDSKHQSPPGSFGDGAKIGKTRNQRAVGSLSLMPCFSWRRTKQKVGGGYLCKSLNSPFNSVRILDAILDKC